MDNKKADQALVLHRVRYYSICLKAMLTALHIPPSRIQFVVGSSFQESGNYIRDLYNLTSKVIDTKARKAGTEVVKQSSNRHVSDYLYPIMQTLDEHYLDSDAQLGGNDQRKIFTFAEEHLPLLGYDKRSHLLTPMVGGLKGGKMSASDENSKIGIFDDQKTIQKKVSKALCAPGDVENPLLTLLQHVLLPLLTHIHGESLVIPREEQYGGQVEYDCFLKVHDDFKTEKVITPALLF